MLFCGRFLANPTILYTGSLKTLQGDDGWGVGGGGGGRLWPVGCKSRAQGSTPGRGRVRKFFLVVESLNQQL